MRHGNQFDLSSVGGVLRVRWQLEAGRDTIRTTARHHVRRARAGTDGRSGPPDQRYRWSNSIAMSVPDVTTATLRDQASS